MACDGYKEPNPPAQYNPQLPVLQLSDVTVDNGLTSSYNLISLNEEGAKIELAKVACAKLGAGYNFGANAYISKDDFVHEYPVTVVAEKVDAQDVWQLYIEPSVLSNVYHENITWSNDEAIISIRYNLTTTYTTNYGTQTAIVGGSENIYGPYQITITPMEAEEHYFYLYTPGATNGWNQELSQWLYSMSETGPFMGYAVLGGEFKFSSQLNWDGINYGAGEDGLLSTDGGAGNLTVDVLGLYWCEVNIEDLEYKATLINTIGVVGDATPGGWDASTALTQGEDYLTWTGDITFGEGEWKFRANDGWDVNLGGALENLTQNGGNLPSPGAGTYQVTLNLSQIPYSCTVVKK